MNAAGGLDQTVGSLAALDDKIIRRIDPRSGDPYGEPHQEPFLKGGMHRLMSGPGGHHLGGMAEDRLEPLFKTIPASQKLGPADPSADERESGQRHQRDRHRAGRLMDVAGNLRVEPGFAEESKKNQPPDVQGRQASRHERHHPVDRGAGERQPENFILAEKARKQRCPDDRQGGEQKRPVGDRYLVAQAPHFAHVLLSRHGVDHAARAQEQQGLEVGVRREVENPGPESADAASHHHVAQLADRGVGQHPLDVVLGQRDGGGEDGGEGADTGHNGHGGRSQHEQHVRAGHHVYPGGDHGGGVNQGADRRGSFHGVRQPDVQRKLRGLSYSPDKEQQGHRHQRRVSHGKAAVRHLHRRLVHLAEVDGTKRRQHEEHAQDEASVPYAVHDECLFSGVRGRLLMEVETDQQIRAEPHSLPAHKQEQVIVGQHQREHGKHEQVHVSKETVEAIFVGHVADRVDVNQEADPGDHQHHHGRERIQQEAPVGLKLRFLAVRHVEQRARNPCVEDRFKSPLGQRSQLPYGAEGDQKRDQDRSGTDQADQLVGKPLAKKQHDQGAAQREQRDHPDGFEKIHCATIASLFCSSPFQRFLTISSGRFRPR